jgi:Ca2+/H+ antiporter, TMEM165/GDT1 family
MYGLPSFSAAIAVVGGRLIATQVSECRVTAIGGMLFLVFGAIAAIEARS